MFAIDIHKDDVHVSFEVDALLAHLELANDEFIGAYVLMPPYEHMTHVPVLLNNVELSGVDANMYQVVHVVSVEDNVERTHDVLQLPLEEPGMELCYIIMHFTNNRWAFGRYGTTDASLPASPPRSYMFQNSRLFATDDVPDVFARCVQNIISTAVEEV